jgi:hypothetical protein
VIPHLDRTVGVFGIPGAPAPLVYRLAEIIEDQVRDAPGGGTATFHIGTGRFRIESVVLLGGEPVTRTPEIDAVIVADARRRGIEIENAGVNTEAKNGD